MTKYILALDQGTTSSRAIVFGHDGRIVAQAQEEFEQILPAPGIVEHDPEAIWGTQLGVARRAMAAAQLSAEQIAALGVTNQRETTILWHRRTGRPVANAVVWQSRISAGICDRLKAEGCEPAFRAKTGLVLDPYFSGTKIKHLLDTHDGLRAEAQKGDILFGTVDSWLIWRTERRAAARDRLQQCQPHAAVQHPHARLGRRAARAARHSPRHAARRCGRRAKSTARRPRSVLAGRSPLPATPAISRRPPSARHASRPAAPRTPTAPVAFC